MNFQDMQNEVLFGARQRGVNYGNSPANSASDLLSPIMIARKLNDAYNDFLKDTSDSPPQVMPITVATSANARGYSLRPCGPSIGGALNPAAMRVKRVEYTYAAGGQIGQTKRIRGLGTQRFDQVTFQQALRLGAFAAIPACWAQIMGRPDQIDFYPGTATAGDYLTLWIVPDPIATGRLQPSLSAALGGPLVNDADVPLLPDEFHKALVEGALHDILRRLNRKVEADDCLAEYERYVDDATDFGVVQGEGESDHVVEDVYPDPLNL